MCNTGLGSSPIAVGLAIGELKNCHNFLKFFANTSWLHYAGCFLLFQGVVYMYMVAPIVIISTVILLYTHCICFMCVHVVMDKNKHL